MNPQSNEDTLLMSEVITAIENDDLIERLQSQRDLYSKERLAITVKVWAWKHCREYIYANNINFANVRWLTVLTHINMLCM